MQSKKNDEAKHPPLTEERFTDIYSSYSNKVYAIAYKMTGNETIAEDITQETFIQVYNKFHTFRGESSIFTWIYAITKNICLRHFRTVKRSSFQSLEDLINSNSISDDGDHYDQIEKREYINQVKEGCLLGLLRCLSFYQRISFILHILFNIPVEDVSKIISKSANATRVLIHRARMNIKTFLCKNCSLYDNKNHCNCENLVSFSLKQGWIHKDKKTIIPERIESELQDFKKEIYLFKALPVHELPGGSYNNILHDIKKKHDFEIFSDTKVK